MNFTWLFWGPMFTYLLANTNTFSTDSMVRASGIWAINFITKAPLEATCTWTLSWYAMAVTVTVGYFAYRKKGEKRNENIVKLPSSFSMWIVSVINYSRHLFSSLYLKSDSNFLIYTYFFCYFALKASTYIHSKLIGIPFPSILNGKHKCRLCTRLSDCKGPDKHFHCTIHHRNQHCIDNVHRYSFHCRCIHLDNSSTSLRQASHRKLLLDYVRRRCRVKWTKSRPPWIWWDLDE